jgi:hypothetical protein
MRRISVILAMAVALIASSFMLTSADARDRNARDGYQYLSITVQGAEIDVGDTGPSLGDYFVFHDKVYRLKHHDRHGRHHRRNVGVLNGQCTTTYLTKTEGTQQCLVTASFRNGDLTVQGVVNFSTVEENSPDEATLAVTGGTGRYSGAGGEVHVKFLSDTKTLIRFSLN